MIEIRQTELYSQWFASLRDRAARADAGGSACWWRQAHPRPGHEDGTGSCARTIGDCHGKD